MNEANYSKKLALKAYATFRDWTCNAQVYYSAPRSNKRHEELQRKIRVEGQSLDSYLEQAAKEPTSEKEQAQLIREGIENYIGQAINNYLYDE